MSYSFSLPQDWSLREAISCQGDAPAVNLKDGGYLVFLSDIKGSTPREKYIEVEKFKITGTSPQSKIREEIVNNNVTLINEESVNYYFKHYYLFSAEDTEIAKVLYTVSKSRSQAEVTDESLKVERVVNSIRFR